MSKEIISFEEQPEKKSQFVKRLMDDLKAFELMLKEDYFEKDTFRIGAEQEMDFVDEEWNPLPIAIEVIEDLKKEFLTTEYAKFNIEINAEPKDLRGKCFTAMKQELHKRIDMVKKSAAKHKGKILLTGILPTLKKKHLSPDALTPVPRYETLLKVINNSRGRNYEFNIKGLDELISRENPVVFGGSFTSFQVHLQVDPRDVVQKYNWAQAISGPMLACSGNSPLFLGKRLWHETRIALFQQTSDTRKPYANDKQELPRVTLGNEWIKDSISEVFYNDISNYRIYVGTETKEDPMEMLKMKKTPKLEALSFNNGTIYHWNRLCYGVTKGKPHLRIENRYFPSGPSMEDQIANAAFWVGVMQGMPEKYENLSSRLDFDAVLANFHKAARFGMEVEFSWLDNSLISARDLISDELLPMARKGLIDSGVDKKEVDYYLGIISARVENGVTGSQWMLENYNRLLKTYSSDESLATITAGIFNRQNENIPVHQWEPASRNEAGLRTGRQTYVDQIMSTNLYTVLPDDLLEMAINIMKWKGISHLPVEDESGKMVGLLTQSMIFNYLIDNKFSIDNVLNRDVMLKDFISIKSEALILDAINLMLEKKIGSLPVVENKKLLGLITEHDFLKFSRHLFEFMKEDNHDLN